MTDEKNINRKEIEEAWELIPGLFDSLSEVAKLADFGAKKYGVDNWKTMPLTGNKSCYNHAVRHCCKASNFKIGSEERIFQLTKAAWNLLVQIYKEKNL